MDDYDRYEGSRDWFEGQREIAKINMEDSTRGLYMLIEKQNKLIENQGRQQIALLEKILNKLERK